MYPLNFFSLFPPFPRENKIFVAMDFDSRFDNRWEKIIKPAVESIKHKEISLEPYRVDMGKGSDSILTDILIGIGNCQLFFADLTTIGYLDRKAKDKKAIRNWNVMYEIGIAQTVRLPEEVILFKSDDDDLPFDLANVRVNKYDPDNNPEDAKKKVKDTIEDAFKEINLQKHLAVSRVAESLDFYSFFLLLMSANSQGIIEHPKIRTVIGKGTGLYDDPIKREIVNSIPRLIELGILSTQYNQMTPSLLYKLVNGESFEELLSYKITTFGKEVLKEAIIKMNISSQKRLQEINDSSTPEELLKIVHNSFLSNKKLTI